MQGKPSRRTWQYPRCAGEAIAAYMALSKEGGGEERGGRKEEGAGGRREEEGRSYGNIEIEDVFRSQFSSSKNIGHYWPSLIKDMDARQQGLHRVIHHVIITQTPLGMEVQTGCVWARVLDVWPDYPAHAADICKGFVLVRINDQLVSGNLA